MTDKMLRLKNHVLTIYENPYVAILEIKIDRLYEGEAYVSMSVTNHLTNSFRIIHGGALASLADVAMGLSCITLGKRVKTLEMNMNFLHSSGVGELLQAKGKVIHNGNRTMVVENEVVNQAGILLLKARGTFFVAERIELE